MAREEKSNVINRDMNKDEKLKALDAALTQIEKAYGKGLSLIHIFFDIIRKRYFCAGKCMTGTGKDY